MLNSAEGSRITGLMAGFSESLREAGLTTHVRAVVDSCRAAALIDLSDRNQFHAALRANFVTDHKRFPTFDQVFEEFWAKAYFPGECRPDEGEDQRLPAPTPTEGNAEGTMPVSRPPAKGGASGDELLMKKDLRAVTDAEEPRLKEIMDELLKKLATRESRRFRPGGRSGAVDLRRTIRNDFRSGGELIRLLRREKKTGKRQLAFLGDVSGSMDLYSRFFFQLAHGFARHEPKTEVYAFSTRLFPLTAHVRGRVSRAGLTRALDDTRGWSGGTRIGECLKDFHASLAKTGHLSRTVVIVLSDGWDRGERQTLQREIVRLKSAVSRIYWLNPLKGDPGYKPLSRGMATVLPYLDGFYAANSVESLADFAARLGSGAG